jgi:hypothetical protein
MNAGLTGEESLTAARRARDWPPGHGCTWRVGELD